MEPTCTIADLGQFKYDGLDWVMERTVSNAKIFTYRSTGRKKTDPVIEIAFEVDDEDEFPSVAAITLVLKALANEALLARAAEALWENINGRGPASGMWWYGDLAQVAEGLDDQQPLREAKDLYRLKPYQMRVLKGVERYRKPVIEIKFRAAFEEEHGVGILSDGESILGTGYSSDVVPFETPKKRPAPGSR